MEIKFRRKGQIVTRDVQNVPESFKAPSGHGVDMTGYSVIFLDGRKSSVRARAEALAQEAPKAVVVYSFDGRIGYGDGVILPLHFNPEKLTFYKTKRQLDLEAEEARLRAKTAQAEEAAAVLTAEFGFRVSADVGFISARCPLEKAPFSYSAEWLWGFEVTQWGIDAARESLKKQMMLWDKVTPVLKKHLGEDLTEHQIIADSHVSDNKRMLELKVYYFDNGMRKTAMFLFQDMELVKVW